MKPEPRAIGAAGKSWHDVLDRGAVRAHRHGGRRDRHLQHLRRRALSLGAGAGRRVATQNVTLPSIGLGVLDRIERGADAQAALDAVLAGPVDADYRQVTVIDHRGRGAHFTGARTLGTNAVATGTGCIGAGNLLRTEAVPAAMVEAFQAAARAAPRGPVAPMPWKRASPPAARPVHSAACSSPTSSPGRWSICASIGTSATRSPSCATSGRPISRRCRTTSRARSTPHPLRPTACRATHERAEAACGLLPRRPSRFPGADGPDRDPGRPGLSAIKELILIGAIRQFVVDLVPPKMVERRRVIPLGRID